MLTHRLTHRTHADQQHVDPCWRSRRRGASIFEVFVSMTLLVTVLSASATLIVQHTRLLVSARHYRLACDELSNQLERLTAIPASDLPAAVDELEVSPFTAERLHDAKLTATLSDADVGQRLALALTWNEPGRRQAPLTLAAWIYPESKGDDEPVPTSEEAQP